MLRITAALALLVACTPMPEQRQARGLYADLYKAVEFRENNDWVIDRLEIQASLESVMESVCSTDREAREDVRIFIETEIAEAGGSSEELFRREGLTRRVKAVRRMERVRAMLDTAEDAATECPYWLEPDERFAGLESDERRVVVLAETRGGGAMVVSDGDIALGGGGGGRILLAAGLGPRLTLGVGYEVGAEGRMPETPEGRRSFEGILASSVPVLLRVRDMSRIVDVEVAWTQRYDSPTRHGVRVGIGYGLTTPRVSAFMPYGVIWIGYGLTPAAHGEPTDHTLWLGTRVGFDWDP
ncbi:MAG: hypothetical protein R3B99_03680 [Polyangiales bacterium]